MLTKALVNVDFYKTYTSVLFVSVLCPDAKPRAFIVISWILFLVVFRVNRTWAENNRSKNDVIKNAYIGL